MGRYNAHFEIKYKYNVIYSDYIIVIRTFLIIKFKRSILFYYTNYKMKIRFKASININFNAK